MHHNFSCFSLISTASLLWKFPFEGETFSKKAEKPSYPLKCSFCSSYISNQDFHVTHLKERHGKTMESTSSSEESSEEELSEVEEEERKKLRSLGSASKWWVQVKDNNLVYRKEKGESISILLSEIASLYKGVIIQGNKISTHTIFTIVTNDSKSLIFKADSEEVMLECFDQLGILIFENGDPSTPVAFDSIPYLVYNNLVDELTYVLTRCAANSKTLVPSLMGIGGFSIMYDAVCNSNIQIIRILVRYGCTASEIHVDGYSLFHILASLGNCEMLQELLVVDLKSINVINKIAPDSLTPLHAAVFAKSASCVELLCSYGASIHLYDCYRKTPLHHAAENNYEEILAILLAWTSEDVIDFGDCEGNTALHLAASHGHYPIAVQLLETAADPSKLNKNNFSALTIASSFKFHEIVNLIEEYGGGNYNHSSVNFENDGVKPLSPLNVINSNVIYNNNNSVNNAYINRLRTQSCPTDAAPRSPPSSPTYNRTFDYPPLNRINNIIPSNMKEEDVFDVNKNKNNSEVEGGGRKIDRNGILLIPISPLNILWNADKERRLGRNLTGQDKLILEKKKAREKRREKKIKKKQGVVSGGEGLRNRNDSIV